MLLATVLALTAAVLHASWNLLVKQSTDRRLALWGQFTIGGTLSAIALTTWALVGSMPHIAWGWALFSGAMHVPYLMLLSRAYDRGDFSMSYPIVRGAGALAAAAGGVLFLHDTLSLTSTIGILLAVLGLFVLAKSGSWHVVGAALSVASTIAVYSVVDGHGTRQSQPIAYALALNIAAALFVSLYASVRSRKQMIPTMRAHWKIMGAAGVFSTVAYMLVMIAYRHAPVGYVASLRESSVVIAAFAGWKMLDEGDHRRRITSAAIVLVGLIVLVIGG
ncbi:MAG: EamA family transporter [Actinomycetota bacterium]